MSWWMKYPAPWINDSHKNKDIFMPSTKAKKAASSKGKEATPSKPKEAASSKAKSSACKGKGPTISKIDDDKDEFMSSTMAKKAPSTKGKRVA
jgi:hypothetical protein